MKKLLLTFGVLALSLSAGAQNIDNMLPANDSTFENGEKNGWSSWGNDSSSEIVSPGYESDYCLQLNNVNAGSDYYTSQAAYDIDLTEGETYYFRFWAKCNVANGSVQVAYQQSTEPYEGGGYLTVNIGEDWTLCEKSFTVSKPGMNRILINFGKVVGEYEIDNIEFGPLAPIESGDNPAGVPADYVVLLSGNTTNGSTISAWNPEFTGETTHAGKSCIEFTNGAAGDSYSQQLAIIYDYEPNTMYYITFDVMGTPSDVAIGAWYQDNSYATIGGYSTFNTFTVTSEDTWTPAVLNGKYEDTSLATRVAINLGEYVGTMYITNIRLYGPESTGVKALETLDNAPKAIYNLQGVKVSKNNLGKGIYIVNGKKVVIR